MSRSLTYRLINIAVSGVVGLIILFPILWGFATSLKETARILVVPPDIIPNPPTLEHYASVFERGLGRYVLNTVIVSAATVLLCIGLGFLAGYALARLNFPGKRALSVSIIVLMSIPLASLLVPTFVLLSYIGLLDTRTGLVLLYTAYELPLTVWLIANYIRSIPESYEHAAMMDGYSRISVIRKITLPLAMPVLVAAGLFTLTFAWNDFVVAVTMNATEALRTLPVGIYNYLGIFSREWGPLTASAMISIIPVVAVFVFFQRYFLSGLTGGGIKG
uniref:Carbohydrate ABC transporter membrane protein 2, CUT1 family n=1 Tax=Chelativorans sp. (strain BNC1) TaxID=266779 RepID=Q11FY4_CHESB